MFLIFLSLTDGLFSRMRYEDREAVVVDTVCVRVMLLRLGGTACFVWCGRLL